MMYRLLDIYQYKYHLLAFYLWQNVRQKCFQTFSRRRGPITSEDNVTQPEFSEMWSAWPFGDGRDPSGGLILAVSTETNGYANLFQTIRERRSVGG